MSFMVRIIFYLNITCFNDVHVNSGFFGMLQTWATKLAFFVNIPFYFEAVSRNYQNLTLHHWVIAT